MWNFNKCLVVVAHPDDETLWAGGTMLMHPDSKWTVICLCRKSDSDRAPKFQKAMERYGAHGLMGDIDDGPEQDPLLPRLVRRTLLDLLPPLRFDLVLTHGFQGEYTSHRRHQEVGAAVMALWDRGDLSSPEVWRFAYDDGEGRHLPLAIGDADVTTMLPRYIWQEKYDLITQTYGFAEDTFEAKATPKQEAFWRLHARNRKG